MYALPLPLRHAHRLVYAPGRPIPVPGATVAVRKIIQINEELCTGCGRCVPACAEGAIEIVGGKAKVVRDIYCDGLGACIGECPQGALRIVEREAEEFNEAAAKRHVQEKRVESRSCGCPSAQVMMLRPTGMGKEIPMDQQSQLLNWPIQMRLVPPGAPYFQNASLLLAGDCTAFAFASTHQRFLRGRATIIGCPKLDDTDEYVGKLTDILQTNDIKDITILHMEVPCCANLRYLVSKAIKRSGKDVPVKSYTVRRNGELLEDAK